MMQGIKTETLQPGAGLIRASMEFEGTRKNPSFYFSLLFPENMIYYAKRINRGD